MATSSPHASISGRNRAIQDAWRANLAAKGPFSRRGTRNHAWREDVASAARPFRGSGMRHAAWPNGLCALRQRHAARGMAERALRPAARAWPACRMRPLSSRLCPPHAPPLPSRPRSSPPSYMRRASPPASRPPRPAIRRAAHCGRGERRSGSFRRPRAVHADASRPPMRARRHRPSPNPRQPNPGPEPTESRPPVEPSAPTRAPPPAAPHPAARVPLRFR